MNAIPKILPLFLAAAPFASGSAQTAAVTDSKVIETNSQYSAKLYGLSLSSKPAMSLVLKIASLDDRGLSELAVTGGQPGAKVQIVASFEVANTPVGLGDLGGTLLVGTPAMTAVVELDAHGELSMKLDLGNPALDAHGLYLQAISVEKHRDGLEPHFSNGLAIQFAGPGKPRP